MQSVSWTQNKNGLVVVETTDLPKLGAHCAHNSLIDRAELATYRDEKPEFTFLQVEDRRSNGCLLLLFA